MADPRDIAEKVIDNVEKVIIGKKEEVTLALITLMCHGHALIDDVPGVGKTMLARSVATSIGCSFKRIQFTPDLLPSDITGVSIYNQQTTQFEFRPGPVMAQVVLADEINRATPKTQSALLECMEERQISVDGVSYNMPAPFIVLATQNPVEYEGTFPLPEAQLDRFMMRISLGYPSPDEEISIIDSQRHAHPIDKLEAVTEQEELLSLQAEVGKVYVDELIKKYIVSVVEASRNHPDVYLGASPRGSLFLTRTAQAKAFLEGRDFVLPDDVKTLAAPVLAHRVIINPTLRSQDVTGNTAISNILETVPVPGVKVRS